MAPTRILQSASKKKPSLLDEKTKPSTKTTREGKLKTRKTRKTVPIPLTSEIEPQKSHSSSQYKHEDYNPPTEQETHAVLLGYQVDPLTGKDCFFPNFPEKLCYELKCDKWAPHTHKNADDKTQMNYREEHDYQKAYQELESEASIQEQMAAPAPAFSTRMRVSGYVPKPTRRAQESAAQAKQESLKHKGGVVKSTSKPPKAPKLFKDLKIPSTRTSADLYNSIIDAERKFDAQSAAANVKKEVGKEAASGGGSVVKNLQIDATVPAEVVQVPGLLEELEKAKKAREDGLEE